MLQTDRSEYMVALMEELLIRDEMKLEAEGCGN